MINSFKNKTEEKINYPQCGAFIFNWNLEVTEVSRNQLIINENKYHPPRPERIIQRTRFCKTYIQGSI